MTLKTAKFALETINRVKEDYQSKIEHLQSQIDYYKRMTEGRNAEIAELEQIIKDHETAQNALD